MPSSLRRVLPQARMRHETDVEVERIGIKTTADPSTAPLARAAKDDKLGLVVGAHRDWTGRKTAGLRSRHGAPGCELWFPIPSTTRSRKDGARVSWLPN